MKKTIIALAILSTSIAYADTTPTTPATTAPTTATTAPTTTAQPAAPAKPAPAPKKHESSSNGSGSVYESVRSGWNSFIDVLTGTKDPGK